MYAYALFHMHIITHAYSTPAHTHKSMHSDPQYIDTDYVQMLIGFVTHLSSINLANEFKIDWISLEHIQTLADLYIFTNSQTMSHSHTTHAHTHTMISWRQPTKQECHLPPLTSTSTPKHHQHNLILPPHWTARRLQHHRVMSPTMLTHNGHLVQSTCPLSASVQWNTGVLLWRRGRD